MTESTADFRIVLRGFSLGGAGAWHLALHHPDRWVAAEIGAGTWPRRYTMMDQFPPHQRPTLRIWENMTEWALNAFNLPLAGHDGDSDPQVASIPRPPEGAPTRGQLESSIRVREQLVKEGFPSEGLPNELAARGTPAIFLISENTGHSTSPKVRQRLERHPHDASSQFPVLPKLSVRALLPELVFQLRGHRCELRRLWPSLRHYRSEIVLQNLEQQSTRSECRTRLPPSSQRAPPHRKVIGNTCGKVRRVR